MTTAHPKGHTLAYVRVSSVDQDTSRQIEALNEIGYDKLYEDKASGKDMHRPKLKEALEYLRAGDTLAVHSLDRLARNLADLLKLVKELTAKGITVRFLKENLTFTNDKSDHMATLMLSMLGAFAEFERSLIRERQLEGIAIAKKAGAYKGRKQSLTDTQISELRAKDELNHGKGRTTLAKEFGVSRETLYRYLKRE